jgi:phosphomannomutase
VPSPAVALYGLVHRVPAIMVTGSHIPADRNGIKFNKGSGEILKADETAIRQQCVCVDDSEVIHLRPSGNAPEFRCYTEATSQERAVGLNAACMEVLRGLL